MIDIPHTSIPDKLLTAEEVAAKLSLSSSKIYQMMASGTLPYLQMGRSKRVDPADLAAYIDSCKITGSASIEVYNDS